MPSRELSTSVMSGSCPTVGPDWVAARVREPAAPESALLLLDCRPPDQFARCRLRGALGVSLPASLLVLRRLSNGKLCVSSVLRDARQRDAFEACYRQLPIVLYDADGSYADVQVTGVLVQRLRQDGCQVFCLQGTYTLRSPTRRQSALLPPLMKSLGPVGLGRDSTSLSHAVEVARKQRALPVAGVNQLPFAPLSR
ncbi:hypothetical protein HPB49_023456 [Dermacentor silvarum]|uniref:Uncharacterized protein n=1 Tax=Dermacentor silvarum TaxID=543639 RepID=A0ACB8DRW5_DERSI|nr:hypothetical protein HPB49_023456 [Dermacentor silvarum]